VAYVQRAPICPTQIRKEVQCACVLPDTLAFLHLLEEGVPHVHLDNTRAPLAPIIASIVWLESTRL
jgi:hypothetical protein